jgi:hypothetical protein
MKTYRYRLSPPRKQMSPGAIRTIAIMIGLMLMIDIITVKYFPQVQATLTLQPQAVPNINNPTLNQPARSGATAVTGTKQSTKTTVATTPIATTTKTNTQTPINALAQDTFARPDQPLWGTASNGQAWGADAAKAQAFSIADHTGIVSNASGIYDATIGPRTADSEVVFSGSVSHFAASNMGVILRWTDANNLYKIFLDGSNMTALKKVNGVVSVLQSIPFAAQDGKSYTLHVRIAGTGIAASAWLTGQAEPANWMLTANDTSLASGFDGLRLIVQIGVTIRITSFLETKVA